jgi:hypothetical protein
MMNSKKFIDLFDNINWQNDNHFIKSIYCNVYKVPSKEGFNCKVSVPNIDKVKELIILQGCFSTGDAFWNVSRTEWFKTWF